MVNALSVIMECSRFYSLPMTVLSWLVVFVFGILSSGNILYGILALIGVCFAHLGTNILDDFFDYKTLIKQVDFNKKEYLANAQKTKCRYLVSGILSETNVLTIAFVHLFVAGLIGLFFYIKCGKPVLYFALGGAIIVLFYSLFSRIKLSEIAVGLAYGPLLYGGVYYVMTKSISWEVFVLSLPTMFMTIILLYIHTVMDYDFDLKQGHKTIANSFDSQLDALILLKAFMYLAYSSLILLCIFDISDWQVLLSWLTIPLAMDLYKSMKDFAVENSSIPEHKWYHFPMENMKRIRQMNAESFMIRMYQSRNLMIYFSIILSLGLFLATI